MANSKEVIINNFDEYLSKIGGNYSDWYIGVTKDAKDRLFNGHAVDEESGSWIYNTATSDTVSREVEKHYLDRGCSGGGGGGDDTAVMVYAYKKTTTTKQ